MKNAKYILFAIASVLLSCVLMLALILGVDIYLHKKFAKVAGLNVWGYRGPIIKKKKPGEQRIVVLGGSTAFGYGVLPEESFPAYLERKINDQRGRTGQPFVSVVNLAYNNEGAYSFIYTLKDYEYLNYDIVIFYEGYNDVGWVNKSVYRHTSPVFKLTGYMPIFPVIFSEKAKALRCGGDIESAYWGKKTVFKPNLADRASAYALEEGVKIGQSLERYLGHLTVEPKEDDKSNDKSIKSECEEIHKHYCNSIYTAAEFALNQGKRVVVVTQPYVSDRHIEQQRQMANMLKKQFSNNPNLLYVNLGFTINLKDLTVAYDGVHLVARGNERIAEALVQPVMQILTFKDGNTINKS